MVVILSEELAVLIQGPLGDFGQSLLKLLPCPFVANGLQGARGRLGPEDPLDGSCLKSLITDGVLNGAVDILTLVMLLHAQDGPGLEPAVSGMSFGEPREKRLGHLSQLQKGLSDRLKAIAYPFGLEVIRVFYPFAKTGRISLMPGDEFNLGAVDQDFLLRGLETQDIGDVLGRDGVVVRLKLNEPVWTADPKRHLGAVIGMKWQRLKRLLGKEFQGSVPGRVVDMQIRLLFQPPPGDGPEVFEILEVSSIEQIPFYVLKRCLNFSFRLSPPRSARNGFALIMGDKGRKRGVKDRPSAFPSKHHRFFIVIKTLSRDSSKVLEGILMSPDQAVEVMAGRKVDVLTPGEAQDVGEALHLALAATGEGNGIGTPIHLTLLPRIRFKPYHWFSIRGP